MSTAASVFEVDAISSAAQELSQIKKAPLILAMMDSIKQGSCWRKPKQRSKLARLCLILLKELKWLSMPL